MIKRCSKCVIPETHETIIFDKAGVCNICRQHELKKEKIDWPAKEKELVELIEQYRGKYDYDCIIPFSGGKDSTFTLYHLVKKYKVKPLVVSYDHHFYRPKTIQNVDRTIRALGVDFLKFQTDWQVVKKTMRESFIRKGDFCWHCHTGIFAYPMQIAVKYNVPLVFWGEPSAEYTSYYGYGENEEVDEKRFNMWINLGITADDMSGMINVPLAELDGFRYPSYKQLSAIKCRSVCLGSYIPWDVKKQSELIMSELGWEGDVVEGVPPGYSYEKVECMLTGMRDYIKFIKRGYARVSHLSSIDIRNNRLTRAEAEKLIAEYEGKRPQTLDLFLKMIDMREDEFNRIALSHAVSPYKHDFAKTATGNRLYDQDVWDWRDL
ncbi:MAG: N-acetyl sugar amidotransferase [Candidatus Margulisbacteria bacterium]|nr:N-acetyl sugar amidotransferase [Candidatus Margulisiibacteriota bacterium]